MSKHPEHALNHRLIADAMSVKKTGDELLVESRPHPLRVRSFCGVDGGDDNGGGGDGGGGGGDGGGGGAGGGGGELKPDGLPKVQMSFPSGHVSCVSADFKSCELKKDVHGGRVLYYCVYEEA